MSGRWSSWVGCGSSNNAGQAVNRELKGVAPIALAEIYAARARLGSAVLRTPLVRLDADGPGEIWLKLENLQPIGSFKLRGAGNAILAAPPDDLRQGIVTASAGNMAQGVAWWARRLGVPATAIVPDHAPAAKTNAIERLGGRVVRVPFDRWWRLLAGGRVTRSSRAVRPSRGGPEGHRRERHDRAGGPRRPAVGRDRAGALWRRRHGVRDRLGAGRVAARDPGDRLRGGDGDPAGDLLRRRAGPRWYPTRPVSSRGSAGRVCSLPCGRSAVRCSPAQRSRHLDAMAEAIRTLAARHRVVAEGAGAASVAAALRRSRQGPDGVRRLRAATSTLACWRRSCRARPPAEPLPIAAVVSTLTGSHPVHASLRVSA